uniref:ditrans,polycis-polyprenyl diphosphate synthase [(2E,6E)-farnesyldiphosphate specific] n=1 Tax=Timema shepardi TaxID=629360 RepID=A0A7R9AM45_TIMSH|nr:unnamed protein product [Timema shepardi]
MTLNLYRIIWLFLHALYSVLQYTQYMWISFRKKCEELLGQDSVENEFKFISKQVKLFDKLPCHLVVIVGTETISFKDLAKIAIWCMTAGISFISFYEHNGVLKKNEAKLFELLSELRNCELGNIVLGKNTLLNGVVKKNGITSLNKFHVNILSWRDGRGGLVDITSRLCRLVKTAEVKTCEIDQNLIGSLIHSEVNIPDPDLAIYCGKTCSTFGLLPWQIRVTEFLHLPTHHNINVKEFLSLLDRFGCCEQRFGK